MKYKAEEFRKVVETEGFDRALRLMDTEIVGVRMDPHGEGSVDPSYDVEFRDGSRAHVGNPRAEVFETFVLVFYPPAEEVRRERRRFEDRLRKHLRLLEERGAYQEALGLLDRLSRLLFKEGEGRWPNRS